MRDRLQWNRRDFLRIAGYSSLSAMSTRLAWPSVANKEKRHAVAPRFVYVGHAGRSSVAANGSEHGIEVFAIEGERWSRTGAVASNHPSYLTLHPTERFLYAINEVDRYENLPSGSVEAYAVDAKNGSLTLLNRQPLSLSATSPRHMAVSPDGRALVVAVHGGGAYNVLPIDVDGRLGRVSGILKETGSGPDEEHQQAAHPQMVIFDRMGRLLSADMGSDKLSVFTMNGGRLRVESRSEARAGSGPQHIALHSSGSLLFVANGLDASVSSYGYDEKNGRILNQVEHVPMTRNRCGEKGAVVMAMHPSGEFVYTAHRSGGDGIRVWRSNSSTGALRVIQHERNESRSLHAMTMAPDGSSLLALSPGIEGVIRWRIDQRSGRLIEAFQVAQVQAPISMVMKYL
jgi:6-phosphogluconolactonase (cycloisomerase 2 family)